MKFQNRYSVWIGQVNVIPEKGNDMLGDVKGAVVNVLEWAKNDQEYKEKVTLKLTEYQLIIKRIEDIELFDFENIDNYVDDLKEKAFLVRRTKSLQWGSFYTYD